MNLISPDRLADLQQSNTPNGRMSAAWQSLLQRVEAWCANPPTMLVEPGGWIHNYICPTHWMPLIYDGDKPNEHRCPVGDVCEGDVYDGAWRAWRHRQIADMSREAALAYKVTGNQTYLAHVEDVLRHYVALYAQYDGADSAESWMVKAVVFNQALTEALWAIPLLHAYDLVAADLAPAFKATIETQLLRPLAGTMIAAQDKLLSEDNDHSNYLAWINCALGCVGFLLNDDTYIHRALDGESGFVNHLTVSVLPDGMQYEVTPYYHNFVVLGYVILAEAAGVNGRDLYAVTGEQGQTIAKMWQALTAFTLPDGTLADVGDGSYWIDSVYDRELVEVYEIAHGREMASHAPTTATLHHAYARWGKGRDHWAALLFGSPELAPMPEPTNELKLLPDSGVAIAPTSGELAAVSLFGAHRGSHSHGDNLSLHVYPFSLDAGCILYGIEARRDWYQSAYAHNGLIIDGHYPQTFGQAQYQLNDHQIALQSAGAFAADVGRTLSIQAKQLTDVLTVSSDTPHQYDWLFHFDGTLTPSLTFETIDKRALGNETGAQFIELYAQAAAVTQAAFTVVYNDQTYRFNLQTESPVTLYLATCPGTSWHPEQRRHTLIARSQSANQRYKTEITYML